LNFRDELTSQCPDFVSIKKNHRLCIQKTHHTTLETKQRDQSTLLPLRIENHFSSRNDEEEMGEKMIFGAGFDRIIAHDSLALKGETSRIIWGVC
jgi:hypothetical protein